jgi:ComEC/Rec2-related protein
MVAIETRGRQQARSPDFPREPGGELLPGALNRALPDTIRTQGHEGSSLALLGGRLAFKVMSVRRAGAIRVAGAFAQEAEFGHLFHWTPVFLGIGAATWFAAGTTPALAPLLTLCVVSSVVWLLVGPSRVVARAVMLSIGLAGAGALLAAFESARRDTVLMDGPVTTTLRGIVTSRQIDADGRWRYDIRVIETERPLLKRPPRSVRVTALARGSPFALGDGISGRARLSPPSGPALVGLNDFAFDAYFGGTGAFGFFYGRPEAWQLPAGPAQAVGPVERAMRGIEQLRGHVSARIRSLLPGDTGAFAASMVTDDRRAMSKETAEALRLAGLTHVIAISGLNMALAAGLFFVGLRLALSLSQTISHRWPVKKIAAAGALASVTGYYLISGFAVSAERAYIMMAIMLVAVFFGRPSISLRNVALSAIVILVLSPSAVVGPGFQMSYVATLALVAGYAAWQRHAGRLSPLAGLPVFARFAPVWHFMLGVFMTSLIGGFSTALYSIEHFHRLAAWGLPANLLAMPVISFVVMPAGLAALMLMPVGLDWLPIAVMGLGLDFVIAVAKWTASLGGDVVIGRIPDWLFVGATGGLLALAIMRSFLRFAGLALAGLLLLAACVVPAAPRPDIVVFEDGSLVGLLGSKGIAISERRPSSFVTDQWRRALRADTLVRPVKFSREEPQSSENAAKRQKLTRKEIAVGRTDMRQALETSVSGRFTCREKHWCVARLAGGLTLVVAINGAHAGAACDLADIVVTPARLKWSHCRSGALLITGQTLRRTGSLEIHLPDGHSDMRVTGAMEGRQRPWSLHRLYDWRSGRFEVDS